MSLFNMNQSDHDERGGSSGGGMGGWINSFSTTIMIIVCMTIRELSGFIISLFKDTPSK